MPPVVPPQMDDMLRVVVERLTLCYVAAQANKDPEPAVVAREVNTPAPNAVLQVTRRAEEDEAGSVLAAQMILSQRKSITSRRDLYGASLSLKGRTQ
eukprot:3468457-Amphidinium_carterae.1